MKKINDGDFIEYAEIFIYNFYGTDKSLTERILNNLIHNFRV